MNRKISFSPGEFYHLHNRGVEKRVIFENDRDKRRFISLLYLCNTTQPILWRDIAEVWSFDRPDTLVDIGAYCLMSNHFHLLVKAKDGEGLSRFMQKLQTAYSMYFNLKYRRSGALFQGKFSGHHINNDKYLNYLYCYIHLNPIKLQGLSILTDEVAKLHQHKNFLNSYSYSSYLDYIDLNTHCRPERQIIKPENFPDYFSDGIDFDEFITDWLKIRSAIDKNDT